MKYKKISFSLSCAVVLFVFFALLSCGRGDGVKQTASFDGVKISYEAVGKGDPALVFIHGWSCNRSHWDVQRDYFSKKHRVVMLDLAGHGASGKNRKEWTMEAFGKDVAAVVEKEGLKKVVLIGHSMGGAVCLNAAKELKGHVVGIVGVDNFHDVTEKFTEEKIEEFIAPFRKDFVKGTENFLRGMFPKDADPAIIEKIAADIPKADPDIAIALLDNFFRIDKAKLIRETDVPIHLINADFWPTNFQEGKSMAGSTFELTIIRGVGHFLMMEAPERFNTALESAVAGFLK